MKTYIITGTSGGLGNAFFKEVLAKKDRENARIVCLSRRFLAEQEEAATQDERIVLFQTDLADVTSLPTADDFAKWIDEETEEVVFINNAAVVEPIGPVGTFDDEAIIQAVQVNVTAAMLLTNTLFSLPAVERATKRVRLLNISSGAAKRPIGGWAVYCAVKAGNEMFYDVLATRYEGNANMHIHNINPGVMDTNMQATIRKSHFPDRERFLKLKEENQLPTPESVAQKILSEYGGE
ncbi:MAG TPA: SDR family NAD(P)-dependent oxidoreductase [Bacilli bacterium]|nr:SDR family NAD(P)-dependent oxidoreductase [Bacilli bacterium]